MTSMRAENISFGYDEPVFSDISFSISDGDKIGLVGNNGSGKSTLLKCLAGIIEPDKGSIIRSKGLKVGYIEQAIPTYLLDQKIFDVIAEAIPAEERDYSGWKVELALEAFGATEDILTKKVKELSGGWQRIALIARTSMADPDILMLDEPTNHLDLEKILKLEAWLRDEIKIPFVAISHDRQFLDNCTNRTLFLRGAKVHDFNHPYSAARGMLTERDKAAQASREDELKEIDRLKRSAHTLKMIGKDNRSDAASRKSKQISDRAEKLAADLTEVHVEEPRDIRLGDKQSQADRLITLSDFKVMTPDGAILFTAESVNIKKGERVVIMGINGAGKSQFLRQLVHAYQQSIPNSGHVQGGYFTPSIEMVFLDQHLSHLDPNSSISDFVASNFSVSGQNSVSLLVQAGFPHDMQSKKIADLSFGQRSRIAFLGLRLANPNLYIMDEPTNHLDVDGQERLEREILDKEATCILVSHDRRLVENLGTEFYLIHKKRLVKIPSPTFFYEAISKGSDAASFDQNVMKRLKDKTR